MDGARTDQSSRDIASFAADSVLMICASMTGWMDLHAACFSQEESKALSRCVTAKQLNERCKEGCDRG